MDSKSIDSLKWLFIDPSHRLEAVNQTSRQIVNLLFNEKSLRQGFKEFPLTSYKGNNISQVNLILSPSYFPDDTEAIGTNMLRELKGQVEGDMNSAQGNLALLGAEMEDLLLQEAQWGVNLRLLQFFKSFLATMADVEQFHTALVKFKGTNSTGHQLGRELSSTDRALSRKYDQKCINDYHWQRATVEKIGEGDSDDWFVSTGCMEVWHDAGLGRAHR